MPRFMASWDGFSKWTWRRRQPMECLWIMIFQYFIVSKWDFLVQETPAWSGLCEWIFSQNAGVRTWMGSVQIWTVQVWVREKMLWVLETCERLITSQTSYRVLLIFSCTYYIAWTVAWKAWKAWGVSWNGCKHLLASLQENYSSN